MLVEKVALLILATIHLISQQAIKIRYNLSMRGVGIGFAYLMVYSSPIQVAIILWGLWIISASDYTFLGLSSKEFLYENLLILHDFAYSLFWGSEIWKAYLDFGTNFR